MLWVYYIDINSSPLFPFSLTCLVVMEITFFLSIQKGGYPDLLATSGDYLRVWRVSENESRLECLLNNVSPGHSKKAFQGRNYTFFVEICCTKDTNFPYFVVQQRKKFLQRHKQKKNNSFLKNVAKLWLYIRSYKHVTIRAYSKEVVIVYIKFLHHIRNQKGTSYVLFYFK